MINENVIKLNRFVNGEFGHFISAGKISIPTIIEYQLTYLVLRWPYAIIFYKAI